MRRRFVIQVSFDLGVSWIDAGARAWTYNGAQKIWWAFVQRPHNSERFVMYRIYDLKDQRPSP